VKEIIVVGLVEVGFAFKGYTAIGDQEVTGLRQPQQPLNNIYKVKRDNEQFQHLAGMDLLMSHVCIGELSTPSHEDESEEVDGCEACKWYEAIDNTHNYPFTSF